MIASLNNQIYLWILTFSITALPPCMFAAESVDDSSGSWEIRLRTDYLAGTGSSSSNRFDAISLRYDERGCMLWFLQGKRYSKAVWRERHIALSAEECGSAWKLVDRDAVDAFESFGISDNPGASRRYQLTVYWRTEPNEHERDSTMFSRIKWTDEVDQGQYSKIRSIVEKLLSLKQLVAPPTNIPQPNPGKINNQRKTVPSEYSGIRGHVSHPHGVPWDRRQVYPITVIVLDKSQAEVMSINTNMYGDFKIRLQPGSYTICPQSCTDPIISRGKKTAVVEAGALTIVNLHFDSGMR